MKIPHFSSKTAIAFVALASAVLSACSSGNDITTPDVPQTKESTLTIDLKPVETRAAAKDISTDNENTINRVAVGIFDSKGNVKVVKTFENTDIKNETVSLTTSAALTTADHVLVACNAPATKFTDAIPNEAAFRAKTITIDEALYGAGSHTTTDAVDITNLPMFGHTEALTQDANNGTVFNASVDVYHLVSKVTLESFTLEKVGAMANASFVPEGIFLAHVPDQLDFQNVTATSSAAAYFTDPALTYSTYYHGCMTKKPTTDNAAFFGKAYLGMDATTSTTDQSKSVDGLVAYTMPNSQTDDDHATFLVVRGKFYFNSSDKEGTEVWYPLYINYSTGSTATNVGVAKKVYPNFNYKMKVTVKGFGETPAYDDNGNPVIKALVPKTVNVTVSPQAFVDASSEVTLE
jgi:hypothetical protein